MRKNILAGILLVIILMAGCGASVNTNGVPDPDKIVPGRDVLIDNLEDSGYTITALSVLDGADFVVDRVVAKKGDKFIDIAYGLSYEEAGKAFELYCELYPNDYYILARNGNYIYCVSDKKTFSKAGFKSTANVGVQYISD